MPNSHPPRSWSFSCTITTSMVLPAALARRSSSASLLPAACRYVMSLRYSKKWVTTGRPPSLTRTSAASLVTSMRPFMADAMSLATARAPRLFGEAYTTGRLRSTSFWRCSSPGMKSLMLRWTCNGRPSSICSAISLSATSWNCGWSGEV
eukprot:scaffold72776_cov69-Phaeocystis_antarctica.AAC.1